VRYGFSATLHDNPVDPDERIIDAGHYLRICNFVKMGKRILYEKYASNKGTFPTSPYCLFTEAVKLDGWLIGLQLRVWDAAKLVITHIL
jgi:hypothetical protein